MLKSQWDHWDANISQTGTSLETKFGHNVALINVLIRAKFDGIPITGGRDKNPAVCHGKVPVGPWGWELFPNGDESGNEIWAQRWPY